MVTKGIEMKSCLIAVVILVLSVSGAWAQDIFEAAKKGDLLQVQESVKAGADVNGRNSQGWTPLIYAAYKGHGLVVTYLVTEGANINLPDGSGQVNALTVSLRNEDMVKLLLAKGADINYQNVDGRTPLFDACLGGLNDTANFLIEKGADIALTTKDGFTVLMAAAFGGAGDVIDVLLKKGADVKVVAEDGTTALIAAAMNGDRKVIEKLITSGANVNAVDRNGQTALTVALAEDHVDAADILIKNGAKVDIKAQYSALFYYLTYEEMEALTDDERNGVIELTILPVAASGGHTGLVSRLLEAGADANDQANSLKLSPLMAASASGHTSMMSLLISSGAEINAVDTSGRTALMAAAAQGKMKAVELLLKNGADITIKDSLGKTAFDYATDKGHRELGEMIRPKAETKEPEVVEEGDTEQEIIEGNEEAGEGVGEEQAE